MVGCVYRGVVVWLSNQNIGKEVLTFPRSVMGTSSFKLAEPSLPILEKCENSRKFA